MVDTPGSVGTLLKVPMALLRFIRHAHFHLHAEWRSNALPAPRVNSGMSPIRSQETLRVSEPRVSPLCIGSVKE